MKEQEQLPTCVEITNFEWISHLVICQLFYSSQFFYLRSVKICFGEYSLLSIFRLKQYFWYESFFNIGSFPNLDL